MFYHLYSTLLGAKCLAQGHTWCEGWSWTRAGIWSRHLLQSSLVTTGIFPVFSINNDGEKSIIIADTLWGFLGTWLTYDAVMSLALMCGDDSSNIDSRASHFTSWGKVNMLVSCKLTLLALCHTQRDRWLLSWCSELNLLITTGERQRAEEWWSTVFKFLSAIFPPLCLIYLV